MMMQLTFGYQMPEGAGGPAVIFFDCYSADEPTMLMHLDESCNVVDEIDDMLGRVKFNNASDDRSEAKSCLPMAGIHPIPLSFVEEQQQPRADSISDEWEQCEDEAADDVQSVIAVPIMPSVDNEEDFSKFETKTGM